MFQKVGTKIGQSDAKLAGGFVSTRVAMMLGIC